MTFDDWIKEQPEGVAACDHVTFGRKVWEAAKLNIQTVGFTCSMVKGGVVWKTWPEDMAEGTQIYTCLDISPTSPLSL